MRFWVIFKVIAGFAVVGVVSLTAMLSYHVAVKPIGGIFEKIIPDAGNVLRVEKGDDFTKVLDSTEMPDFEPGDRAFAKAHELIALGKIADGRKKMLAVVNVFPSSPSAPNARRIVGEMNLDEILSSGFLEGKYNYEAKSGDSYLAIASRNKTTLDMIIHLNGMMELNTLQPGDELQILPLNFRLVLEPQRKAVSLWDDAKFVCEYPILRIGGTAPQSGKTEIASRRSMVDNHSVSATDKNYRASMKFIQLLDPALQILPYDETVDAQPPGIFLSEADLEELFLLTRVGNEVEIRNQKK